MTADYESFIASKTPVVPAVGLTTMPELGAHLFPFQRDIVAWALRRGRAAVFADTGLGKGPMALEWLRRVEAHAERPVLLLAPLAVSHQFARESAKFGVTIRVVADGSEVADRGIHVTNYHKLHKFDTARFGGVAIDESSILKSFNGATRNALIESFAATPFRLALTATPSPNDHAELGNHAEFLGVMSRAEMLATFFVHDSDSGSSQGWRLKGHARSVFWRWVASWAASLRRPSDIGYSDDGYILPPLTHHEHVIAADHEQARSAGMLFAQEARSLDEQRRARRATLDRRVEQCAAIVNAHDEQSIVWCDLNDEGDALESTVRGAVQVAGKDSDEDQERKIASFLDGTSRVLIGKPSQLGFGLNLQNAREVVFCGVTHSFEQYYQAIRRVYRHGQTREVRVHIVTSELEGRVLGSLKRKEDEATGMAVAMVAAMADHVRAEVRASRRETDGYAPTLPMRVPSWLADNARAA